MQGNAGNHSCRRVEIIFEDFGVIPEENDLAFEMLEHAYQERTCWMIYLKVEPRFDLLREDARFSRLIERVGLV